MELEKLVTQCISSSQTSGIKSKKTNVGYDGIKTMELAIVNNYEQAKLFFEEFDIPYEIITRGENKGKLRVKPIRQKDHFNLIETASRLKDAGLGHIVDHRNCFRNAGDDTVCTFSPYTADRVPEGVAWLKMSDYSIYGMCTKTFVVVVPN